jgi:hypothetical protein
MIIIDSRPFQKHLYILELEIFVQVTFNYLYSGTYDMNFV